ncbi:MAG: type II secretion system F family protein [Candidatus Omnitrophota bacterium]
MSPIFAYKARDKQGALVKGILEAGSQDELIDKLHKMGYLVISLGQKSSPAFKLDFLLDKFTTISITEKLLFYIQFANLIQSSLPILTALKTLSSEIKNRRFKLVLEDVVKKIESGLSLSEALANHSEVFSGLLVHMVKAGEASGALAQVLTRFSKFAEEDYDLRQRVKAALFYPVLLSLASAALIIFITSFVVPSFVAIFQKAKVKLPISTRFLYWLGMALRSNWFLFLISIFLFIFVLKWIINTKKGRLIFDSFKLNLPLLGDVFRKLSISRFSRTLATLDASGVPILKSLEISKEVMGNKLIEKTIEAGSQLVEQGSTLYEALRTTNQFPEEALQMISAGEQGGNLAPMLSKLSDYYEKLIDYRLKRLVSIIEPAFLVIVGGVVAFIMASMLMPIFDMVKVIRAMK